MMDDKIDLVRLNEGGILSAPCICCGYSGAGYYQKGTHNKKCRFYDIGGLWERTQLLERMANNLLKDYLTKPKESGE